MGRTRDVSVLGQSAVARIAGIACVLLVLWVAVAWAVAVP